MILADQEVVFKSAGVSIHASTRLPDSTQPNVPGAVIIAGSGPVDRNGSVGAAGTATEIHMDLYRWIAELLATQGVASLRYDKITSGATGLGPYSSDPAQLVAQDFDNIFVQPARDALAYLAAQPGIDPERLIVIGHSEGGLIAMLLAVDTELSLCGLVLAEPSYARLFDVVSRQLADQVDLAAVSAEVKVALKKYADTGLEEIRQSSALTEPSASLPPLDHPEGEAALWQDTMRSVIYGRMRNLLMKSEDALVPIELAAQLNLEVLITAGTKDFNTPATPGGQDGSGVSALAAAVPAGLATYVELPNVTHILRDIGDADPMGLTLTEQINCPYSTLFADVLQQFVSSRVN
ncbi:MAG: alpha/beta fold hydrolase [Microthrixaceae bacterium]